jgi:hypothetical protein
MVWLSSGVSRQGSLAARHAADGWAKIVSFQVKDAIGEIGKLTSKPTKRLGLACEVTGALVFVHQQKPPYLSLPEVAARTFGRSHAREQHHLGHSS